MKMKIRILNESGYEEAMLGLSLSYNKPVYKMYSIAKTLYEKDGGHNKFLESIVIWIDITAPRYWWAEFDTYRIGVTKQSESTMHTITKRALTQDDFNTGIPSFLLEWLNNYISAYEFVNKELKQKYFQKLKEVLPEGFLQRRIICTNYKVLRHIINQRKNHRLEEWQKFVKHMQNNCKYKKFLKW